MEIKTLEENEIDVLKKVFQERTFHVSTELFYEGHVPHVGYILVDGNVHLGKRKKVKNELRPGSVLGVKELMTNTPSQFFARIYSGSKVFIVDRSTLKGGFECPMVQSLMSKILGP